MTARRVVMDLNSLAFELDGDAIVERNIEGNQYPVVVKGDCVGWSLVSNYLELLNRPTNQRESDVRWRLEAPHEETNRETRTINQLGFGSTVTRSAASVQVERLAVPESAIDILQRTGVIEAGISNPFADQIMITDRRTGGVRLTRSIVGFLQGKTLAFTVTQEDLRFINSGTLLFKVPDSLKGKYRTAKIVYQSEPVDIQRPPKSPFKPPARISTTVPGSSNAFDNSK